MIFFKYINCCFLFLQAGAIDEVFIPRDEFGVGNFAFITYRHAADVSYALDLFQGVRLFGRVVILRPSGQITPFNAHLRLEHGNYVTSRAQSLRDNPVLPTSRGIPTERARHTLSVWGGPSSPEVHSSQGHSVILSGVHSDSSAENLISEQAEQVHPIRSSLDNGQMMNLAIEQTSDDQSYLQTTSAFNVAQHPTYVQPEWNYQSHSNGMHYSEDTNSQNLTQSATTSAQYLWHYPEPTSTQTSGNMETPFTRETVDVPSYSPTYPLSPSSLEPHEFFKRPRSISSVTTCIMPETYPAFNLGNYQSWATNNPGPSNTQTSGDMERSFTRQNPDVYSYVHNHPTDSQVPREFYEQTPRTISSTTTYVIPETAPTLYSGNYQYWARATNSQNGQMNNLGPLSTQTSRDIEKWFEEQYPAARSYAHNHSPGLQVPRYFCRGRPRSISSMTTQIIEVISPALSPENYQTWATEHTSSQDREINNPGPSIVLADAQARSRCRHGQFVQTHRRNLRDKRRRQVRQINRQRQDEIRQRKREEKRKELDEVRLQSALARREARDERRAQRSRQARPARTSSV